MSTTDPQRKKPMYYVLHIVMCMTLLWTCCQGNLSGARWAPTSYKSGYNASYRDHKPRKTHWSCKFTFRNQPQSQPVFFPWLFKENTHFFRVTIFNPPIETAKLFGKKAVSINGTCISTKGCQNGQIPTCQAQGYAPEIRLKRTKH